MKIVLSSIGSRGDVEPLLALAVALRDQGHTAHLCVAPNFQTWIEAYGFACTPLGPDLRQWSQAAQAKPGPRRPLTRELRRTLAAHSMAAQWAALTAAARDAAVLVGGGMLLTAASSVAELLGIPYAAAVYAPVSLPSSAHPPATLRMQHPETLPPLGNRVLWALDDWSADWVFAAALNAQRAAAGLPPVQGVNRRMRTAAPLLACDPLLGPAAPALDLTVTQTGAWFLADPTPLPPALEDFLNAGTPPVYFGFGSMAATPGAADELLAAARSLGRRALILRGWANLECADAGADYLLLDAVNHALLLPRVAAAVHHGGAGTTAAVARAGVPQVILPHLYDQRYWGQRVSALGIGMLAANATASALAAALRPVLEPACVAAAQQLAPRIERAGAARAAELLLARSDAGR